MTEEEAEELFKEVEDDIFEIVKDINGFKYLALRKRKNDFYLEFSYDKKKLNDSNAFDLKQKIKDVIPDFTIEKIRTNLKIKDNISETSFKFHINELNPLNDIENNEIIKDNQIQAGDEISNRKTGTLGAIVKINDLGKYYIFSNYHVIMGAHACLNEHVRNAKGNNIAKLFWGKFNNTHDVALAEIINKKIAPGTPNYQFGKINKVSFSMNSFRTFTSNASKCGGNIYSTMSIVKIEEDTFKDQILFNNFYLNDGDSGSIIVEENKKESKDVIGICMAGDHQLDVANKLSTLFNKEIQFFTDSSGRNMPSITFKSFY